LRWSYNDAVASSPRLTRRRVLVTRTPGRASELTARLQAEGATVISIPTIEIVPPESYGGLDDALARLDSFDWVIFTSAHAVEVFVQHLPSPVVPKHIAVVGPATARAVEQHGFKVSLLPQRYVAESLAEALAPQVNGANVLFVRAAEARDVLSSALIAAGGLLTIAEAYRNRMPAESIPQLRTLFATPANFPDAITFTSASTARNLMALLEAGELTLPAGVVLASIGPITSQALRDLGLEPTVEANESTIPALTEALASYFERKSSGI